MGAHGLEKQPPVSVTLIRLQRLIREQIDDFKRRCPIVLNKGAELHLDSPFHTCFVGELTDDVDASVSVRFWFFDVVFDPETSVAPAELVSLLKLTKNLL